MEAVLYIGFAVVEAFSVLYFILIMFRTRVREFKKEIVLSATIISIVTYLLRSDEILNKITPLLMIILLFALLIFMFNVPLVHSFYVAAIGYVTCFLVQGAMLYGITLMAHGETFAAIKNDDFMRYSVQTLNAVVLLLAGSIMGRKGIGFTFVPSEPSFAFKVTKKNFFAITFSVIALTVIGIVLEINSMLMSMVLLGTLLSILLYAGIREERSFGR